MPYRVCLMFAFALAAAEASRDQGHWPQWRGPFSNGMAQGKAPVHWSDSENIKWKKAIAGRGFSTPVIWGGRIFITTAIPTGKTVASPAPGVGAAAPLRRSADGGFGGGEEQRFVVLCLDRSSGAVLWERTALTAVPHEGHHRTYGSFASNSALTDGRRVYVSFGSRGLYCYDVDGTPVWSKDLGVQLRMRNEFGEGAGTALDADRLIVSFDQESDSFIAAFNKNNGRELWRTARDEVSAWSTPLVVEHNGRKQVIVAATRKVRAYDIATGRLIWECSGLGANVIPSPVYQGGMVYVMSGHRDPKLMAIRLGREGDLTGTDALAWTHTRGLSYTPSPVLHDGRFYALTDTGMLSCFKAVSGEPLYQQKRLPVADSYKASPVGADGKLYLASEGGVVTVVRMGDQFEVLAANSLEDQMFVASPVIAEGELYLRSKTHVFAIREGISN